ncbi:MAG: hypothetical protein ACI828_002572 [Flavobacteriales bacterium]|jgi:hypothetical protein
MRNFLCLLGIALLTSCGAVYVDYDYDKNASFDGYATYNYNFVEDNNLSEFDQRRYVKYTDSLLQTKDLQLAEDPDLWITTTAKSYEASSQNTLGVGIGGGGNSRGVSFGGGIPIGGREEHLELTIDFYDAQKKQYVWQAYCESARKVQVTPQERNIYFEKIVSKVYSKYPPKN